MKKQHRVSMDGFVSRQASRTGELGEFNDEHATAHIGNVQQKMIHNDGEDTSRLLENRANQTSLGRSDIRSSLQAIDDEAHPQSRKERKAQSRRRKQEKKHAHSKRRRIIKRVVIVIVVIVLAVLGFLAYRFFIASGNIFQGNILGLIQEQRLKEDANGRSNFVIFGTAEDSEGGEHGGANLTDSIMVLSINQTTNDAYMVNIPRDLWVRHDNICSVGYEGKINATYFCASNDGQDEETGAAALQKKAGEVLGLDIQYYAHLNFTALTELVDAVGGVEVTIESNPPGVGILDRNFDWKCNYECYYVRYDDGEVVHLDGEHALALARARNASGGHGLQHSNFDREKNQQKIMRALREKAVSAGTLTNISSLVGIIDALGNNLRTNVQTNEVRTLARLGNEIEADSIRSLTLNEEGNEFVTTGMMGAESIVQPVLGVYDFSAIHAFIRKNSSSNPVEREAAPIVVLNGTNQAGVARQEAEKLEHAGFSVSIVDDAPAGQYQAVEVYQKADNYESTARALRDRYDLEAISRATPPVAVADNIVFVIVIGAVAQGQ